MDTYKDLIEKKFELDKAIESARREEIQQAIAKILVVMDELKIEPEDLGFRRAGGGKSRVQYRDPDSGKTWCGIGRTPKWIKGKPREQFRVR
ncbi:h-ns histone-like nucleoid-structuring protein [Pandoraea anhela]|uniref:H-ns histone-like nucleoid-structuring protein n=2 Tax=Pandoraea anhela TaxID=2508295 RepID=A0A5E4WAT1_9BURK|nr:h-ns histone-like nucleoid-structuring protein [Pandoraea anhela]